MLPYLGKLKIGKNNKISRLAKIYDNVIIGNNNFIGDNVVISGNNCFQGCSAIKSITIGDNFRITGLNFLEDCFENQNVELVIGYNYTGYPIYIPQKIFNVNK